jgi:hypothetical protein
MRSGAPPISSLPCLSALCAWRLWLARPGGSGNDGGLRRWIRPGAGWWRPGGSGTRALAVEVHPSWRIRQRQRLVATSATQIRCRSSDDARARNAPAADPASACLSGDGALVGLAVQHRRARAGGLRLGLWLTNVFLFFLFDFRRRPLGLCV